MKRDQSSFFQTTIPTSLLLITSFDNPERKKEELRAMRGSRETIALVKLEHNRVLLYSGACATKVWDLSESHCMLLTGGGGREGLAFPEEVRTRSVTWGSIDWEMQNEIKFILQTVLRIENFASTVGQYYRENKKHQAFSLLATGVYAAPAYRSIYESGICHGRTGVIGIGLDLIQLALEADLEFDLAFSAVRVIWEEVTSAELKKNLLSPKVFGLSGCVHWLHADSLILDPDKAINYLSSLDIADITRENVVSLAMLVFNLLCGNASLVGTAPAFYIFANEDFVNLCLESVDFRRAFNKKVNNLGVILKKRSRDYPEIVFTIIRQAYTKGQIDFACREDIILQILRTERRCTEFTDCFACICDDVIQNQLISVARAILGCKNPSVQDFIKNSLSKPKRTQLQKMLSPTRHADRFMEAGVEPRMLTTPARVGAVCPNSELVVSDILALIRGQLPQVAPPQRRSGVLPPDDIDYLCKMVVMQHSNDREKHVLARVITGTDSEAILAEGETDIATTTAGLRERLSLDASNTEDDLFKDVYEKLMLLLQRPIIVLDHGRVNYYDYKLRGQQADLEIVRRLANESERPIIIFAEDVPSQEEYIKTLIKDYNSKIFIVFENGDEITSRSKYRSLWCDVSIVERVANNANAVAEIRSNRESMNALLVYEESGKWYIYGKNNEGIFFDNQEISLASDLGRMLADKNPLQVKQLLAERTLLEEVALFLNLDRRKLPPEEPLFVYLPDRGIVDYCDKWLVAFGRHLKVRLENGINVTQAFLMLELDCFVDALRMSRVEVREYLKGLGDHAKRMEMVDRILNSLANSEHRDLVVCEETAVASAPLSGTLDFT